MPKDQLALELIEKSHKRDRDFALKIIGTLRSDYAYLEYSVRLRKSYPHLSDLADYCEGLCGPETKQAFIREHKAAQLRRRA